MKVLHLPTSVGGNAWGLAQGEKHLGLDSKVLNTHENWLKYDADFKLGLEEKNFYNQVKTLISTYKSIKNTYEVFHFNYGRSLLDFPKLGLSLLELPYYPQEAKKIVSFNGSDIRQVHPLEYWPELGRYEPSAYEKLAMYIKKQRLKKIEKNVDHIFSVNPDLLNFLPKTASFLPYSISNWDILENIPMKNKKLKIEHSPTNRIFKGSDFIIDALKNLQLRYDIDMEIVENIPHKQALEIYQSADIIIDQVLIGWYGAFAVEAMKMGKAVAVYIREEDLKYIPPQMKDDLDEAIVKITPLNIEEELATLIENKGLLQNKISAGLDYVNKWHRPSYVASITKEVYES